MSSTLIYILRIMLSCVCGGAIGFERTKRLKEAGVRTHCIIAAASALMMIVSKYGFQDMVDAGGNLFGGIRGVDAARIAAQVVSGISFLGAGVIFKNGNSVKGLTTAAGIWATAGAGLAIGAGMYILGVILTVFVVAIQIWFHRFSIGNDAFSETDVRLIIEANEQFKKMIFDAADQKQVQILSFRVDKEDNGKEEYEILLRTKKQMTYREMYDYFGKMPGVKTIIM